MNIKSIFANIVGGAAATIGGYIALKGIDAANDPYKKAKLKNKLKSIKNRITKDES